MSAKGPKGLPPEIGMPISKEKTGRLLLVSSFVQNIINEAGRGELFSEKVLGGTGDHAKHGVDRIG